MPATTQDLVAQARQRIREITPDEADSRITAGAVVIDVREADELTDGHVPEAVHIPRGFLEFKAPQHEPLTKPDCPIVVYCKGGGRGALAADTLQTLGYTDVCSIEGGYGAWLEAGKPINLPEDKIDTEQA